MTAYLLTLTHAHTEMRQQAVISCSELTLKRQEDREAPLVDAEDAIACTGQDEEGEHDLSSIESACSHWDCGHLCSRSLVR